MPPFATPASEQSRITILITGVDKTTERTHSLTDTLLVVSVDPATGATSMVSFPRDIARFPLYGGGRTRGKINSLLTYASNNPDAFPDGPLPTVARELGYLLGIPINYYAALDLDGFRRMIDAVGGVKVNVQRAINDSFYNWLDGSPEASTSTRASRSWIHEWPWPTSGRATAPGTTTSREPLASSSSSWPCATSSSTR